MNQLSEKGVDVLDDEGGRYHVSGHANRPTSRPSTTS
jgi:ribonuclease J